MIQHLFDCCACQREVHDYDHTIRNGRDRALAPLCRGCEYDGKFVGHAGSFMDRRKARQIDALADALSSLAHRIEFGRKYGFA
jgi:hypothetical protein